MNGEPDQQEINRVRTLFDGGQYEEALPHARSMAQRFPQHAFGWKALAAIHTRRGAHAEALAPAQKLAALVPDDARAHYNLGCAQQELGLLQEACASYRRALELLPDFAEAHNNLGNTLKALGRLLDAEAAFRQALQHKPELAQAHCSLGNTLLAQDRFEESCAAFRQALEFEPDYVDALNKLGMVLHHLGQTGAACALYERAIRLEPEHAEACYNLGVARFELKQPEEALANFGRAIRLRADYADAYINRGVALLALDQPEAALASLDQAVAMRPDRAEAHSNRGNALMALKQPHAALASFERALALEPDYAEAHNNRGNALKKLAREDAALECFERAIRLSPDLADAYSNRGNALKEFGRLDAALEDFDRAIRLRPDHADAHWNRSLLYLLRGDFGRGWAEYEWGWKVKGQRLKRAYTQPLWLGEAPLAGKTILLHAEQGLGDTLQFCRYAKKVTGLGARVVLEAQKPLLGLLRRLEGVSELVEFGSPPPAFDYHCPLLSLPLAFGTDIGSIPDETPYLSADAGRVAKWRARLPGKSRPRAGLVWSGSTAHKNDRNRSVPLSDLLKILPEGFDYVSLQKELRETDQITLQARPDIPHFGAELADFDDTAALCELVDVVISVDTSVAHLAGALGRPACILLPYNPDWRWLLVRADSPWYPSARLYRQEKTGDWRDAFERLAADLRHFGR